MTDQTPSAQGLKRYPRTAGYFVDVVEPIPCTCTDSCLRRCAGECGCEACSVQFNMFCDEAGFFGPADDFDERTRALARYRGDP